MATERRIRRALISVYDKTGLVEFARALHEEFGIELISTGGTAKVLRAAGLPVTLVEDITGFPEMLDGRVKTLHPKIHAAILADRDNPEHMRQLAELGIEPIDLVVVNLYPFERTIARPDCTFEQAIEMIDIGGPCLLRAAAKNHRHVWVLCEPADWPGALEQLRRRDLEATTWECIRLTDARTAFRRTREYDRAVSDYLAGAAGLPVFDRLLEMSARGALRYGENPHQQGELLRVLGMPETLCPVGDSPLAISFNNYADASAALELCAELTRAAGSLWQQSPTGGPPSHPSPAGAPLWHRFPTGASPAAEKARRPVAPRVEEEQWTAPNLPHLQVPGATYFVTFRVRAGQLSPAERDAVLSACTFWHARKMTLHCASVMPDHVHLLLTPHESGPGQWVSLSELLHSIKRHSANEVNRARGTSGPLWLDESFDRVIRNPKEFLETWHYIEANPVTAGVVPALPYRWFWRSDAGFGERVERDSGQMHRLKTGATAGQRVEAGAREGQREATGDTGTHRLENGDAAPRAGGGGVCAVGFIKHTNACGAAVDADPVEAYRKAYLGDPSAAMGGILAVNFGVDAAFAAVVMETYARFGKPLQDAGAPYAPGGFFVEVWLAPGFTGDAVAVIRGTYDPARARPEPGEPVLGATGGAPPVPPAKEWGRRVRLLAVGDLGAPPDPGELDYKRIAGGMLVQTRDLVGLDEDRWRVVTQRRPTEREMHDLRLAWLICKHTKSNAITICRDGMLIGNGAGQMSRVMSCRIATWLARENGHAQRLTGAAAASDAFFPFRDGPDVLIDAGIAALIQPGGSKRDAEVIAACNERGVAMIFTGTRHFRH